MAQRISAMAESPTRPTPRADLQILRTRHPPPTYLNQLCELYGAEGIKISLEDLAFRFNDFPEEDRVLLAVEGDQLIGYAHLRVVFDPCHGQIAELAAIIVQPHRRREGYGSRLIAAAESWARQANRSHLRLRSDIVRSSGHAFFTALNYQEDSTKIEFIRSLK